MLKRQPKEDFWIQNSIFAEQNHVSFEHEKSLVSCI